MKSIQEPCAKTALIIGYVWPEPNSSAAGSRMMQLICFFQQHNYHVVFASPATLGEHRQDLTSIGVVEESITLNCDSFDTWVKQLQPSITLFDRFMMEEQFGWRVEQQLPDCLRILDTEDLHSLRQARHQRLKQALKRGDEFDQLFADPNVLYQEMAELDICQREIAAIYRCDLSLMISDFEIDLLTEQFSVPHQLLMHLPFMLEQRPESTRPYHDREHFICIGNFRHAPNWDTTLWLKQKIWPLIRKELPNVQLHVYGAYPNKKVTDLHNPAQGFYVNGWAEDAFAVLSKARICLAPLRFGAGIKGKFTDAMLCSTPCITTQVGTEAMTASHAWPGAISNSSKEIADKAVALYQSLEQWQKASDLAAPLLQDRYCLQTLQQALAQRIMTLGNNIDAERKANFTGMLLRHHHHKSTKYMSQWIAAKSQLSH